MVASLSFRHFEYQPRFQSHVQGKDTHILIFVFNIKIRSLFGHMQLLYRELVFLISELFSNVQKFNDALAPSFLPSSP